jgi:hypothetical protein
LITIDRLKKETNDKIGEEVRRIIKICSLKREKKLRR